MAAAEAQHICEVGDGCPNEATSYVWVDGEKTHFCHKCSNLVCSGEGDFCGRIFCEPLPYNPQEGEHLCGECYEIYKAEQETWAPLRDLFAAIQQHPGSKRERPIIIDDDGDDEDSGSEDSSEDEELPAEQPTDTKRRRC
jgi:hypothetical protein